MEKRGMGGLFQINPVTKTGQRLYMVREFVSKASTYFTLVMLSGPHAPPPLPPHHGPDHSEQVLNYS